MMEICYLCSRRAVPVDEPREVPVGNRFVVIDDRFYRCEECGETFYIGYMGDHALRSAATAVRREEGLLMPDEIRGIRRRYGLSQADLERLIGAGPKTVVRWERGTIFQDKTADTLLRVLRDHPEVVAELARENKAQTAD